MKKKHLCGWPLLSVSAEIEKDTLCGRPLG